MTRSERYSEFDCNYLSTDILKLILNEAEGHKSNVRSGNTSWEKLKFTENELDAFILSLKLKLARKVFSEMRIPKSIGESPHPVSYSIFDVDETIIDMLNEIIISGETSWNELGFSEEELLLAVKRAKLVWARFFYDGIEEQTHLSVLETWEKFFLTLVSSGQTTWKELHFSKSNMDSRLRKQRIVILNNHFTWINRSYTDLESCRKWIANIRREITRSNGKLSWNDLDFRKRDLDYLEHAKAVHTAQDYLRRLNDNSLCSNTIEEYSRFILDSIRNGCSWDELEVTKEQFEAKLHLSRRSATKNVFATRASFPKRQYSFYAEMIRSLVHQNFLACKICSLLTLHSRVFWKANK